VDRDSLQLLLASGLSYEEIGKRFSRHPSTVSAWARRHGLVSKHQKHAPRGGLDRERVEVLLGEGRSIAGIAAELSISESTVHYWLRKWGLKTKRGERMTAAARAREEGRAVVELVCHHHGRTAFYIEGRGSHRCMRCRWEAVARRRRKVKGILVREAGGRCRLCGYSRCADALHFHHVDPATKSFSIGARGLTRSLESLRREAAKCALLCANCHAEVEAGIVTLAVEGDRAAPEVAAERPPETPRSGVAQSGRAIGC
jgi:transposase